MSNTDRGKKRSRQNDLSSYFQRPQSKDPHSLHASSSFEQPITERDLNSCENASNIQIIDKEICSSGDQSEINAFSPEIGSINVENISLEKNTTNSRKRQKGQWDIGRGFQPDWVSKFPFIDPLPPKNEKEKPKVICNICSWKLGTPMTFQMKLDTIEKHVGKVYEKKIIDGEEKSIVRWKSSEECRHVKYADEYNEYLISKQKLEAGGGTITSLFEKTMERNLLSKTIQLSTVFHILSKGRPMTDYPDYMKYLSFLQMPNFPSSHWSLTSGWEWAKYLAQVEKDDMKEKIASARFVSLSLDEVTAIDNTSWICMSIYMVNDHIRHSYLLGVHKMMENSTAENIYELVNNSLKESGGMDPLMIAKKLVCVGADGASVMQGQRNGLCVRLQLSASPYMLSIHCMAHRMNLAFKIVSKFPSVSKVEDLVREAYAYFSRSPKRFSEFKKFVDGVTNGNKLLKDVDTRWISLNGPAQRLFSEYQSLVGVMYEHRFSVDKAQDLLFRLTDIETLLTLVGILPMLDEMNVLVKMSQSRTMYIAEYTNARKFACLSLDNLYTMPESFAGPRFTNWTTIIDIENTENYLKFDEKGILCMEVRGYMVPFHYIDKTRRTTKERPVSRDLFDNVVISVRRNLIEIAKSLSSEIRERFPRDELLEAMSVVYPEYWNNLKCQPTLKRDFVAKLNTLVDHFCKKVEVHGEQVEGILDQSKLFQQATRFAETMWNQFRALENPLEYGAITRLWTILGASQYLQENISEYFKLADLCQTMILGSVEDERMFSALSFLKSKMRNKLDKHMDICLRLYVTKYDISNFPYERALALWRSDCDRRGENNITSFSNELDTEHNSLEAHNDNPSGEGLVQSEENEHQDENWEIDIPQHLI
jgi:hypothetical protein